jgi:formylmethanofuran dehydrogenase subunit B
MAEAIAEAARLLERAQQPVIGGLATDLAGVRAAARLADRTGGVIDHMNSAAMMRTLLVLQDGGYVTTTLSEVRNHADLVIVVGTDLTKKHPRFFERTIANRETLFGTDRHCDVVLLGAPLTPGLNLPGITASTIPCELTSLLDGLAYLRAIIAGRTPFADHGGGVVRATWEELAKKIRAAKYSVFVWAGSALDFPHAELTVQALAELIKDVNRTSRSAGLPLNGADGEATTDAALTWQTGYGVRTSFGRGYPSHDSYHLATERLLAEQAADLLVWIASFDAARVPPRSDVPQIVLARADMTFEREPDVFIAVGIPGVDHAGHLFRGDKVLALPLRALRQNQLPTVEYVLDRIATTLGAP